jgi:hypothetical protein
MGGDLNLKKSFHPALMKNQQKVWQREQDEIAERKRTAQRINELKEERAKEEIQRKLEAAGGKAKADRVEWMYQGPTDGQAGTTEEREAYLLGKRRIDNLIKGSEHKNLEKRAGEESFLAVQNANTARDTATKVRLDPMLAIKKQEQAAYEAMMNDPIRRRQLLSSMGIAEDKRKKRDDRDGRDEKRDRKRRHRHRNSDSGDDIRHSKHHSNSRSRSPHERRHRSETDLRRREYRDRSPQSSSNRRGTYSQEDRNNRHGKDESRYTRNGSQSRRDSNDIKAEARSAHSTTDRRHRNSESEDESYMHDRKNQRDGARSHQNGHRRRDQSPRSGHGRYNGHSHDANRNTRSNPESRRANDGEVRARKLAAMQNAASKLDEDRERRLEALEKQENTIREAEDRRREAAARQGADREFVNGLHRKAGHMGLAERIGRGRQGLIRDDD